MNIDFDSINARLLADYLCTLQQWLPNGRKIGPDWCVGSLAGEPGTSLKIHVRKGVWKDFASGECGGSDPVSLYAAIHNLTQAEAARRLSDTPAPLVVSKPAPEPEEGFEPVIDPPDDLPDPKLGPGQRHVYLTEDGRILGYILRQMEAGRKTFRPRTPWYNDEGQIVWRSKGFASPRPLYGLDRLARHPQAVVVLVEGEKCADALGAAIDGTPVLAWPGGSNAVTHVNFEPLRGRRVILWPDADKPGRKAMEQAAAVMAPLGCAVKQVLLPADAPEGWDCADAIEAGWDAQRILDLLGQAKPVNPEPVVVARTTTTTQAARTASGDTVQRVEVREEFGPVERVDAARYGLQIGAGGKYVPCLDSICRIFEIHDRWRGHIWWDSFLERVQTDINGRVEPWTDQHSSKACRWMQCVMELPTASSDRVHEAAMTVAKDNPRNVLTEWLHSLQWDGVGRLGNLLPTGFGTPQDMYHVKIGQAWLLSLVARAFQPGCKVDTMPVFEGSQGAGKSSALAILGGDWFGECHEDFGSKDFVLSLKGKWLIEVAEMHSFRRQDVDRLKGIMSTRIDRVRVPYGRMTEEHPRQSVFAGTTNRDDWQADDTGARRFWAVRCGFLSLDWLRDNRDQLFAEAVAGYESGETWWQIPVEAAARAADERRPEDPWEELLARYLDPSETYASRQLLGHPLDVDVADQTQGAAARVGKILRRLGWVRETARGMDGQAEKRWRKGV
jgi:putative DNA primase/helicase